MADNWKCSFCNLLNECNTTTCFQCGKANPHVVHINQICLCGRKVTKNPNAVSQCKSCCKAKDKREQTYYYCNAKECTLREMTGKRFIVCNACHESRQNSTIDSKYSFLFCKLASLVERIEKETKKCQNNAERRRYMYWVYFVLYKNCIAKLQKVMNENEYEEMQRVF
eukprot:175162_1